MQELLKESGRTASFEEAFVHFTAQSVDRTVRPLEYPEIDRALADISAYPYGTAMLRDAGAPDLLLHNATSTEHPMLFLPKILTNPTLRRWQMDFTATQIQEDRVALIGIAYLHKDRLPVGWRTEVGRRIVGHADWIIPTSPDYSVLAQTAHAVTRALRHRSAHSKD